MTTFFNMEFHIPTFELVNEMWKNIILFVINQTGLTILQEIF